MIYVLLKELNNQSNTMSVDIIDIKKYILFLLCGIQHIYSLKVGNSHAKWTHVGYTRYCNAVSSGQKRSMLSYFYNLYKILNFIP